MNVDALIAEGRLKSASTPAGHPARSTTMIIYGTHLLKAYMQSGRSIALDEALRYGREALAFCHISAQYDASAHYLLGLCLVEQFRIHNGIAALDEAISCQQRALSLRQEATPERCVTLQALAGACLMRFEKLNKVVDLVVAIVFSRGAFTCCPPVLEVQLTSHEQVATSSHLRFEVYGQGHDIADAVEITRRALALTQPGDQHRPWVLEKCCFYLEAHYRHFGKVKCLDEAEVYCQEFIRLCPPGHSQHALASQALGCHFLIRFQSRKDPALLDDAVSLCETALRLRPTGDANRHAPLKSLAIATRLRFELRGENADIEHSISYGQEAVELCKSGSTPRDAGGPLHGLGMSYLLRFEHSGHAEDLEKALKCCQDALPFVGSSAFLTLGNMLTIYRHRYYLFQHSEDLSEAAKCGLEALRMSPPGDPGKFMTLNNLAGIANDRFDYSGKMENLEEAISYSRQSLVACPVGHSDKVLPMINVSLLLSARFEILGERSDMEESLRVLNSALSLCPPGHPSRERCLRALVISSRRCWKETHDLQHLDRAIQCARDALPLYSAGSFDYPRSREYLGIVLYARFMETRQRADLEEAVTMYREALALCPKSNYDYGTFRANLAAALSTRYDTSQDPSDLTGAIDNYSEANEITSTENPSKPTLQSGRAMALLKIVPLTETILADAFNLFEQAANNHFASSSTQFDAALRWSIAARSFKHPSTMNAFSRLLSLLELRLLTKQGMESQQEFLRNIPFRRLSSEAAASAIDAGRLDSAVELLEQGRTMLWSRMRGYRHPIHDLRAVDEALADRFQSTSAQLERTALAVGQRSTLFSSAALDESSASDPIDVRLREHRILSEKWTKILNQVRLVSGFANFLRTPRFDTLRVAAEDGPIILLNVGETRCDAIIIRAQTSPHLVPLPDASSALFDQLAVQLRESLSADHDRRSKGLIVVLRELWKTIVQPVVVQLLSMGIEMKARIWWCPTVQLCALPIHAAGPFTPGERNLPDLFVSSYTPTLTALITARGGGVSASESIPKVLVIGQPETLPMVEEEISEIRRTWNPVDVLLGSAATTDAVISNLRTHSWSHFACHGSRHPQPFSSAFELHRGDRVTVLDIAGANLPRAEFAFLSACHTAAPDIATPDEFITLAAALQFAGFRGVVSTFWEMADEDGPQIARDFYAHMFRGEGIPDSRDAAMALNLAIRLMRKRNVPLHRWVNFIHIGI
ncbi:CHAT domain-containing protein [Mycena polygramma]|nr:CHAT domain-containing protein [Mycena polygramma]